MFRFLSSVPMVWVVCGCAAPELQPTPTTGTSILTPNSDGSINTALDPTDDVTGNVAGLFSYASGRDTITGTARAYVGMPDNISVGDKLTGSATYDAAFEGAIIEHIMVQNNLLSGSNQPFTGEITLIADIASRTIMGTQDGLEIKGHFSDQQMTGQATYRGVDGALSGSLGTDRTVAIFHGSSATAVFAGGLTGAIAP